MRKVLLPMSACAMVLALAAPATATQGDPADIVARTGTRAPALVTGIEETAAGRDPVSAAREHLAGHRARYGIADPGSDLTPLATVSEGPDETVRFAQRHQGVPVFGGQYLVHLRRDGNNRTATGAGGRYFTGLTVTTTPAVSQAAAVERAKNFVTRSLLGGVVDPRRQPKVGAESRGLVVVPKGAGVLTYRVTVSATDTARQRPIRREVYVDARAGFPVLDYDGIAYDEVADGSGTDLHGKQRPLKVTKEGGRYRLRDLSRAMYPTHGGVIATWDATGRDVAEASGRWPDGIEEVAADGTEFGGAATTTGAVDAHWAAGQVYEYYRQQLGRDSLDGRGGRIDSLVGVTYWGMPYVNAFWDGTKMVYGGGDDEYYPLSADVDVVGHEMTHGVVEHTAGLVYMNQSGAMNEVIADYFGNAIDLTASGMPMTDPRAPLLGEDLCRTKGPRECALRDLGDGRMTSNYLAVTSNVDNGGVHLNSTIFSGALWDIRKELGATADRLVYKALSEYMTPLDTFTDGRRAIEEAARALALSGRDRNAVTRAFNAHGVRPGWERVLGNDATTLLPGVTATGTGPNAGGGWWVTSNSDEVGEEPYAVYAGRTDGAGTPQRLSPDDGRYHVYPATDGKTAVWAAYGSNQVQILARSLAGGPIRVLAAHGYDVSYLSVDGSAFAWQITHPVFGGKVLLLRAEDQQPQMVDGGGYVTRSGHPYLADGKLAYLKVDMRPGFPPIAPIVRNVTDGTEVAVNVPPDAALGRPRIAGGKVFWISDQNTGDDGRTAIMSARTDGADVRPVIAEDSKNAPALTSIDATADAITFDNWPPGTDITAATLPKIYQVSPSGGTPVRVSCGQGMQPMFEADTALRVVWLDGSAARTDLVTRRTPAHHC